MIHKEQITGLILAGGRGMRMGQVNKGLQHINGKMLCGHVIERFKPQVHTLLINANRDSEQYAAFAFPVIADQVTDYAGPLAGIHSGLQHCQTPYLACAPCDSPFLPKDLVERLAQALEQAQAQAAVVICEDAESGSQLMRTQAVFSLMKAELAPHLQSFLENGGRKVSDWQASLHVVKVFFKDSFSFHNINTMAQLLEASTIVADPHQYDQSHN